MTSSMPLLTRLADIWRWHLQRRMLPLFVRPDARGIATVPVADTVLPADWIGPGWICYCVGVGEDIVLDRHLTEAWRAPVWAFDPTPRAIAYMQTAQYDRALLHFVPAGIWSEDCVQRFHAPPNPQWVSHSITEDHGGTWFDAQCRAIPSIMRELGHDRIDFIKLNIEGAEHVVLESMLAAGIEPAVVTLTWEGKGAFGKALRWTRRLRARGYRLLAVRDWFFTYVREEARPAAPNPTIRA